MRLSAITAFLAIAAAAPSQARFPRDKVVTVDMQDASIVNVVRLFAEVGGVNVVVADDVKGTVTLKLKQVGWRTALDVALKSGGYGIVEDDGVLWVTSQARIDADESRALDLAAERERKGPLNTRLVPVNNANATDLAAIVRPLLSPRGTVAVDLRTNTLIIRDVRGSGALTTP